MRGTSVLRSPVITFFAPTPSASRRAQEALQSLFSLESVTLRLNQNDDGLDNTLNIPAFSRKWDSVATKCQTSGALLHFVSLTTTGSSGGSSSSQQETNGQLSLLALTGIDDVHQNDEEAVADSRRLLALHMNEQKNRVSRAMQLIFQHASKRPISATDILGYEEGMPLLHLPQSINSNVADKSSVFQETGLKEVVIPQYDGAIYPDGLTIQSTLSSLPYMRRPALGLYQWPSKAGVAFRPIPSAGQDQLVPPPSLVFRCDDLQDASSRLAEMGVQTAKIGFSGLATNKNAQLMVLHKDLAGLDIRLTDTPEYSCGFAEAQQALMAASLDDLQSSNVMLEGGHKQAVADPMNNVGDCWVEVRANLKRPSGYFRQRRHTKQATKLRIAKAPDLPYE